MWRSFDGDNVPKSILLFTLSTTCGCVITSRPSAHHNTTVCVPREWMLSGTEDG